MNLRDIPFILRHSLVQRGLIRTVASLPGKVISRIAEGATAGAHADSLHPFDAEFGTDTGGLTRAEQLYDERGRVNVYNAGYYGTPPSLFQQALARLGVDFDSYTFIDLGAGKGRIILLASNLPFRRVIGVEFARELQVVACKNISLYHPASRPCRDVGCILGDASNFAFPGGPLIIFMWNPFMGQVFERVLANLEESLRQEPREVYVLYLKPDCGALLDASPWLQKLWECRFEMTEQDFTGYRFGGRSEICAAYQSRSRSEAGSPPAVRFGSAG